MFAFRTIENGCYQPFEDLVFDIWRHSPDGFKLGIQECLIMSEKCSCGSSANVWENGKRECSGCYLKRTKGRN
jgi:hypothetical protein